MIPIVKHTLPSTLRVIIGWCVVLLFRLIPNRIPNVEGVMGTLMPVSKRFHALGSFLYAFSAIALYDIITGMVGIWTLLTAVTYGGIGIWAVWYFKKKAATRTQFVLFSIYGTLVYDIITGVFGGPVFFGQPFLEALIGQIPFTLSHLIGNVAVAAVISPLFLQYVIAHPRFEVALTKTLRTV
jgi:uncharacterized membrane protein YuzA (DUF378 family)